MTAPARKTSTLHPTVAYLFDRQDERGWSNPQVARLLGVTTTTWRNLREGLDLPTENLLTRIWTRFPEAPRTTGQGDNDRP
jgi:hypothetical protein